MSFHHVRYLAVSLVLALAGGCASVQIGEDFALDAFEEKVKRGETTQAQVRGWLGPPESQGLVVETSGKQYDEWTYYYGTGTLPAMSNAKLKILQIKFDQQGVVQGFTWSGE